MPGAEVGYGRSVDWRALAAGLRIGGHRGDPASAPENTPAAFTATVAAGADYVETDVHRTSDGVLVLIHDDTVDRTTDGSGLVYELPSKDVFVLDAGRWYAPGFTGERITDVDEFLDWIAGHEGLGAMIEAKPYGVGADLARAVDRSRARNRTCIVSFLPDELRAAKSVSPDIPCYLLFDARPARDIVELILDFGFDGADVQWSWMDKSFVERMHRAALAVVASTVNEPGSVAELIRLGVDYVDTDRPGDIVAARDALKRAADL